MDLTERRVVVTGAGQGLGRAYALALAGAGAAVMVNDVDAMAASDTVAEIEAAGGRAVSSTASVADPAGAAAIIAGCVEMFGGIDGLVNNAGLFAVADDPGMEAADAVCRLLAVNVTGPILCGQAAIRRMGPGAVIVNVVSGAALGMRGMATYGASKGAMLPLTRGWALDLAGRGIQVIGVSPVALTRMTATPGVGDKQRSLPADIAPLLVYLLSGRAGHLSGKVVRLAAGALSLLEAAAYGPVIETRAAWTADAIEAALAR